MVKTQTPGQATHKWENNHPCRGCPQVARSPISARAPQPGGPVPGGRAPRTFGSEGQWGCLSGEPEGCEVTETLLLKGNDKISHASRHRAEVII